MECPKHQIDITRICCNEREAKKMSDLWADKIKDKENKLAMLHLHRTVAKKAIVGAACIMVRMNMRHFIVEPFSFWRDDVNRHLLELWEIEAEIKNLNYNEPTPP